MLRNVTNLRPLCLSFLLLGVLAAGESMAQVTVRMDPASIVLGQEALIPVRVSGVEGGAPVQAFQFTVRSSNPGVRFLGVEPRGTLTQSFTVNANPANGRAGGFGSSFDAFTTSGTMVYLRLRADAAVSSTITLAGFLLNAGTPGHTPSAPASTVTGVSGVPIQPDPAIPGAFALKGNHPNPFDSQTTILFDLPEPAQVRVTVSDSLGRTVLVVPEAPFSAGADLSVALEIGGMPGGIYVYRLSARTPGGLLEKSGTMTVLK